MHDDARPPQPPQSPTSQPSHPQPTRAGRLRLVMGAAAIIGIASLVGVLVTGYNPFASRSPWTAPGSSVPRSSPPPAPPERQILRVSALGSKAAGGTLSDIETLDPALI